MSINNLILQNPEVIQLTKLILGLWALGSSFCFIKEDILYTKTVIKYYFKRQQWNCHHDSLENGIFILTPFIFIIRAIGLAGFVITLVPVLFSYYTINFVKDTHIYFEKILYETNIRLTTTEDNSLESIV